MINNVNLTFNVGETTWVVYKLVLSKTKNIDGTKYNI